MALNAKSLAESVTQALERQGTRGLGFSLQEGGSNDDGTLQDFCWHVSKVIKVCGPIVGTSKFPLHSIQINLGGWIGSDRELYHSVSNCDKLLFQVS